MTAQKKIFYIFLFILYSFLIYYDYTRLPTSLDGNYWILRCEALTYLNLVLQCLYAALMLVNIQLENNTLSKRLDFFTATLFYPVAMLTCLLFWPIFLVDRELVYPVMLEQYLPRWHNFAVHSLPFFTANADLVINAHQHWPSRRTAVVAAVVQGLIYECILTIGFLSKGHWMYGILDILDKNQVSMLFSAGIVVMVLIYFGGCFIHNHFWLQQKSGRVPVKHKTKRR